MENGSVDQKENKKGSMYVSAEVRNKILKVKELLENSKEDATPSQVVEDALNEAYKLLDRMKELIVQIDCFITLNRSL